MTTLKTSLLTAVVIAAGAGAAAAQATGSNTSAVGGNSLNSSTGNNSNTLSDTTAFQSPTISGLSLANGATTRGYLAPSNSLASFYANPFYAGRAGADANTLPGGFGTALYGSTTGGSSSSGGLGSSNVFSAAAGSSPVSSLTGFGGNSGSSGGFGGVSNAGFGLTGSSAFGGNAGQNRGVNAGLGGNFGGGNQAGGVVIPSPGPIAYTATLRFSAPLPTAPQVAADLRGVLDRSSMLTNSRTIDLFTDGSTVVLRGTVPSVQESETAEGMIRLTPGVFVVRNELQVAASAAPAVPAP